MYNHGKFQELNCIILRLRMNKHAQSFAFLGGNMHQTPKYRGYFVWASDF